MIFQFPEYGILALGMMACMIAGGIDLSLVGIMNFTGVLAALIVKNMVVIEDGVVQPGHGDPGRGPGVYCGHRRGRRLRRVQRLCHRLLRLPAMLVTLCGLQLYTGLAYGITGGPAINGMCDAFKNIANGNIPGTPSPGAADLHRRAGDRGVHYEMHRVRP